MGEEASGCGRVPTSVRIIESKQSYPPLAVLTVQATMDGGGFIVTPETWSRLAPHAQCVSLRSRLLYVPPYPSARLIGA